MVQKYVDRPLCFSGYGAALTPNPSPNPDPNPDPNPNPNPCPNPNPSPTPNPDPTPNLTRYKLDLRIYVLLLSAQPLRVYWYKDCLVRFATHKYDISDTKP